MGSATRQASNSTKEALASLGSSVDLATAEQLFAAGRVLAESSQLRAMLADPAINVGAKEGLIGKVFGTKLGKSASALLLAVVSSDWSSQDDLLTGIEDLALRVAAISAPDSLAIDSELFAFSRIVASDNELELALGTKLGDPSTKGGLVASLLGGKASEQTIVIVSSLVQQPLGRRIGALLTHAASVVADQSGQAIATVTSAAPIAASQLASLTKSLTKMYGRELRLNLVIDPSIIGGLRVQVGDDVIDGTVSSRIKDMRLQLAG
jgi:F-type H+-transporting ATPase subunit delta